MPRALCEDAPWLEFGGRWGSSVVAPALQEWYFRAEHPVSRTWLDQVRFCLLSCAPGWTRCPCLFWLLTMYRPGKASLHDRLNGGWVSMPATHFAARSGFG